MKANRAPGHGLVGFAAEIGPFVVQLKRFFKRHARQFGSDGPDAFGGDAATVRYRFGCEFVVQIFLGHLVETLGRRLAGRSEASS